ncbi:glycosyltransferase family 4 protein [Spiribacter sp. 2438]|uniref:glycosyltransferase family 4 protein n=1 Tax=Spiribacter sp. 2438 TaxID=2666185 RepID=UPI0018A2166A|nr:glycosyltransferase family 4 protein [Spiribacter sp. 2438]
MSGRVIDNLEAVSPRRVVHALRTLDPAGGGVVTYVQHLRRSLAERSVELHCEAVFPSSRHWRVLALRWPWLFRARIRARLDGADLLHVHGVFGWHVLLGVMAARRAKCPYVVTLHGHLHPDALRERRLAKWLCLSLFGRRVLEDAAAVTVTAEEEAHCLRLHAPAAHVAEVLPGLDVPASEPPPPERPIADTSCLRLLYLGRLHPHKGVHRLVQALAALSRRGVSVHLTVAGSGLRHYRWWLHRLVAWHGLGSRVMFMGHVDADERAALWNTADALALPSRSENFGFAVAEAMAMGRPVIVSKNVGLASLVSAKESGLVVDARDSVALQAAFMALADPERRQRYGRNAYQAARQALSLQTMGDAHWQLYERSGAP